MLIQEFDDDVEYLIERRPQITVEHSVLNSNSDDIKVRLYFIVTCEKTKPLRPCHAAWSRFPTRQDTRAAYESSDF